MIDLPEPDIEVEDPRSPSRTCAVTREVHPAERLMRFVVAPDDSVVPDLKRALPGRGVWLTPRREIVLKAVKRNVFPRGFGRAVTVDEGLADRVDALLERAALQGLSIARKAGQVLTGFRKVETAIAEERLACLLEATDGAEDGRRKLMAAVMRRFGDAGAVPVVSGFDSDQISLALGLANVIHAAVLAGRAGDAFVVRMGTLAAYRGSERAIG